MIRLWSGMRDSAPDAREEELLQTHEQLQTQQPIPSLGKDCELEGETVLPEKT